MNDIFKFDREMYLKNGMIRVKQKTGDINYKIHTHDYYEIEYYENCRGLMVLNGKEFRLESTHMFLLIPGDCHRIESEYSANAVATIIDISENMISQDILRQTGLRTSALDIPFEGTRELMAMLCGIYRKFEQNENDYRLGLYHLINFILFDILKNGKPVTEEKTVFKNSVGSVMTYVMTDLSKQLSVKEAADICKCSPTYFSALFRRETGRSFTKWVNSVRCGHACRLLEETSMPILDICYTCGYNTPSHFFRTFTREKGMTPSEYRRIKAKL